MPHSRGYRHKAPPTGVFVRNNPRDSWSKSAAQPYLSTGFCDSRSVFLRCAPRRSRGVRICLWHITSYLFRGRMRACNVFVFGLIVDLVGWFQTFCGDGLSLSSHFLYRGAVPEMVRRREFATSLACFLFIQRRV